MMPQRDSRGSCGWSQHRTEWGGGWLAARQGQRGAQAPHGQGGSEAFIPHGMGRHGACCDLPHLTEEGRTELD